MIQSLNTQHTTTTTNTVSAGTGQYLNEGTDRDESVTVKVDADFVCPIYGDSMEPDYKSGDYVFVKLTVGTSKLVRLGIRLRGRSLYQTAYYEKDKAYLRSFNKIQRYTDPIRTQ